MPSESAVLPGLWLCALGEKGRGWPLPLLLSLVDTLSCMVLPPIPRPHLMLPPPGEGGVNNSHFTDKEAEAQRG